MSLEHSLDVDLGQGCSKQKSTEGIESLHHDTYPSDVGQVICHLAQ
jgi:hypothetical protein